MLTLSTIAPPFSLSLNQDETLIEQCLAAGLAVTRSCRNGNCGRCDCQLLSGQIKLRNGNIVQATANVALCISYALSNVQFQSIPLIQQPSYWRCQLKGTQHLRLPAGRQTPPHAGDICALLHEDTVEINEAVRVEGRNIILQKPIQFAKQAAGLSMITIDRQYQGRYSLWRETPLQTLLLWDNINYLSAVAAQAAYRKSPDTGSYIVYFNRNTC